MLLWRRWWALGEGYTGDPLGDPLLGLELLGLELLG